MEFTFKLKKLDSSITEKIIDLVLFENKDLLIGITFITIEVYFDMKDINNDRDYFVYHLRATDDQLLIKSIIINGINQHYITHSIKDNEVNYYLFTISLNSIL